MDFGNDTYLNETESLETVQRRKYKYMKNDDDIIRSPRSTTFVGYVYDHLGTIIYDKSIYDEDQLKNEDFNRASLIKAIKRGNIGIDFDFGVIGVINGTLFPEISVLQEIKKVYTEINNSVYSNRTPSIEMPAFSIIYFDKNGTYLKSSRL